MNSRVVNTPRVVDLFFEFSLLGMLAAGYFAVVGSGYLDWPTAALTFLGLCLRALMVAEVVEFEFSGRLTGALALAYIGFSRSTTCTFPDRFSKPPCTWSFFSRC